MTSSLPNSEANCQQWHRMGNNPIQEIHGGQMPSTTQAEKLITTFQDSFHHLSQLDFWPELRKAAQFSRLSPVTFKLDQLGGVGLETVPLSDAHASLAATYARKFISGGDTVYLKNVLEACELVSMTGVELDEANDIFDQLIEPKWGFRVMEGQAVGMFIHGTRPVVWGADEGLRLEACPEVKLSLQNITEVTFNEGMFHAYEPRKNEDRRAVVRTVFSPLRKAMSNVAIAGTLYVAIILHRQFAQRPGSQCSANFCMEKRILDSFAANRSQGG